MAHTSPARNIAVILASGVGRRFRSETPKQFLKLCGKSVLEHTLDAFETHRRIDEIILVTAPDTRLLAEQIVSNAGYRKVTGIVAGGDTRRKSSAAGIAAVAGDDHKVLVHDAVRPLPGSATIDRCLDALEHYDAVDTAIPASDTIIKVDQTQIITDVPRRASLYLGQTPQGFRSGVLREAHARAAGESDLDVTDDCGLILHYELAPIKVVAGDVNNIKITYPSDIYLADRIFQLRSVAALGTSLEQLAGKVVIVFGGSRGIGRAVATMAASFQAKVVALSRADKVNVADADSVKAALSSAAEEHGRPDIIVNTAAVLKSGLLAGQDYGTIDEQIATNLRGSIVVARESFEVMQGFSGSIALFTSSSYTRGRARSSVYSATKAAVVNLVQSLAEEFRPFGVRINAINPERTATPMRTENFGNEDPSELLDAETVARATLAVALSDANGEVIDVRR